MPNTLRRTVLAAAAGLSALAAATEPQRDGKGALSGGLCDPLRDVENPDSL